MLVCFVFVAVVLTFIVRPTVLANRFVKVINSGDYDDLHSLGMLNAMQSYDKEYTFENVKTNAELKPLAWRDVYKFRRKVWVRITFPKGHRGRESGFVIYVVAHLNGCKWGDEP
jgi:hypothetical protein